MSIHNDWSTLARKKQLRELKILEDLFNHLFEVVLLGG